MGVDIATLVKQISVRMEWGKRVKSKKNDKAVTGHQRGQSRDLEIPNNHVWGKASLDLD